MWFITTVSSVRSRSRISSSWAARSLALSSFFGNVAVLLCNKPNIVFLVFDQNAGVTRIGFKLGNICSQLLLPGSQLLLPVLQIREFFMDGFQ